MDGSWMNPQHLAGVAATRPAMKRMASERGGVSDAVGWPREGGGYGRVLAVLLGCAVAGEGVDRLCAQGNPRTRERDRVCDLEWLEG